MLTCVRLCTFIMAISNARGSLLCRLFVVIFQEIPSLLNTFTVISMYQVSSPTAFFFVSYMHISITQYGSTLYGLALYVYIHRV